MKLGVNVQGLLDLIPLVADWQNAAESRPEALVPSYEQLKRARTELLDRSDGRPDHWPPNDGLQFRPFVIAYMGKTCELTRMEYRLFEALASCKYALKDSELKTRVWPDNDPGSSTITSTLSHIRKKLKDSGMPEVAAGLCKTGEFYRFKPPNTSA